MIKKYVLLIVILILFGFSGCNSDKTPNYVSSPSDAISPIVTQPGNLECVNSQTIDNSNLMEDKQILKNGATLKDLSEYLKLSKEELMSSFPNYTPITSKCALFDLYYYKDLGLSFISYNGLENKFNAIECDISEIDIDGISNLNLSGVKELFGDVEKSKIHKGLPELPIYSLNYEIDNIKLMFIITELNDIVKLVIVNNFEPYYGFIDIKVEQISKYFEMDRVQIEESLGTDYFKCSDHLVEYEDYGLFITYDKNNLNTVKQLDFYSYYRINGFRIGSDFNDAKRIFGNQEIKSYETSEDGMIYYLKYNYGRFSINIESFDPEGNESGLVIYRN